MSARSACRQWPTRLASVAAATLALAAPAAALDRDHWINAISIARAEVGYRADAYYSLFGEAARTRISPRLALLTFTKRRIAVYVDRRTNRGVGVLTWNPLDVTLDRIGPCATVAAFRRAYPEATRTPRGFVLGRLLFAVERERVTYVLLAAPALGAVEAPGRCR